jgi:N-acetylmuramoyl-L-alanine amidase
MQVAACKIQLNGLNAPGISQIITPVRALVVGLLLLAGAGCQTRPKVPPPLATIEIKDDLHVATPEPLPLPPPDSGAWPTNWANSWIPLASWAQLNALGKPVMVPANPHPMYVLQTGHGTLAMKVGSRIGQYSGLEYWLGFAPQIVNGLPYIQSVDAKKTLQPLIDSPNYRTPNGVIVIDPGHGGSDTGTRSLAPPAVEKHYTLDWALRLRPLLEARGWKVILTRMSDFDVSLLDRVNIAERAGAALFLSLHFNSGASNRELAGIETYCLTPTGMPSHLVRGYEDDLRQTFPNNAYDEENLMLAVRLHRSLLRHTGAADRGLRRARFMGVLRGQDRPAVLIEAGYLSNPHEARKISTAEYRQLLAEAVARGLD